LWQKSLNSSMHFARWPQEAIAFKTRERNLCRP
jgi:hypothetical protein